ncbi:DUF3347 domain-containing protein [Mucilaginibacter sp. JRF]|uniref:DUF3347 domain-containing protein n=1 Tax=Mucilaginibacter sp. JRF TaxID=2780088 RepID=UPI00187F3109|nr:DUF3347 domain-containing protein [Mucilaginibacter sp. JRF]MBE9583409.1 DUF3347 domain-containing protein [Mucilaginibacter sp. JRF]
MKRYFITAAVAAMFMAAACNQPASKSTEETTTTDTTAVAANATDPDKNNVSEVLASYIALKNDLVKSDAAASQKSATKLQQELIEVKGCSEAATLAGDIAATDKIADQRKAFLTLSKDVITLAKGIKTGKPSFVAFCPMANEGKGGYWLSEAKEIKNPYYGDDMLECGEVKEELK